MVPAQVFQQTIQKLLSSRAEINSALMATPAARIARENALEGLYLVAVRSFEAFLEDQMLHLLPIKSDGKVAL
jgi:hypothetical protein